MTNLTNPFLTKCFENIDDPVPRMIYADWLEENGEPEFAEQLRGVAESDKPLPFANAPKLLQDWARGMIRAEIGQITDAINRDILRVSFLYGLPASWLTVPTQPLRKFVAVLDVGGSPISDDLISQINQLENLQYLDLAGNSLRNRSLRQFDLTKLRSLRLFYAGVSDADLSYLASARNLHTLSLYGNQRITDAGFQQLKLLKNLENLDLSRCHVSAKGIESLCDLTQLCTLRLWDCGIENRAGAAIGKLEQLESLNVGKCPDLTTKGIRAFANLKQLRTLNLTGTRLTDDGMATLGGLTKLEYLNLRQTKITAAKIKELSPLKQLQTLLVDDALLRWALVHELSEALPNCRVNGVRF